MIKRIIALFLYAFLLLQTFGISAMADTDAIAPTTVTLNRVYSSYSQFENTGTKLRYKMNCYGYAIQVYSVFGNSNTPYKQQPGEFADDQQSYAALVIQTISYLNSNASTALNYLKNLVINDFEELSQYTSEWVIQTTTASAAVPSGYRKIALTIGLGFDFHFYVRHNNGVWSHKQGSSLPTCYSIETGVIIDDDNITSVISEGGYDDGAIYFLIKKSAVSDYPHSLGNEPSCLKTLPDFKDRAGDTITKSRTVNNSTAVSVTSKFDYSADTDFFAFTPSVSGSYTFSTTSDASHYDVNMVVYDKYGEVIASDNGAGNPSIVISLTAGQRYFIRVKEAGNQMANYTLKLIKN